MWISASNPVFLLNILINISQYILLINDNFISRAKFLYYIKTTIILYWKKMFFKLQILNKFDIVLYSAVKSHNPIFLIFISTQFEPIGIHYYLFFNSFHFGIKWKWLPLTQIMVKFNEELINNRNKECESRWKWNHESYGWQCTPILDFTIRI